MKKKIYMFLLFPLMALLLPIYDINASQTLEETDCFSNYEFGSVETQITSNKAEFDKGSMVPLTVKLKNNNQYPIVNGNLYIRVYKKVSDIVEKDGDYVVDQMMVEENLNMEAGEERDFAFTWRVPQNADAGEYKITSFVQVAKKFNMSGLSFTDDIFSGVFEFDVKGEAGTVEFVKEGVKVNGEDHRFIGVGVMIKGNQGATITAPIRNTSNKSQNVTITYKNYSWDGTDEANLINEDTEKITLQAGVKQELSYQVKANDAPVNYTVITAEFGDAKSIINVRTIKQNQSSARINFPGIKKFPIEKGENVEIFSCVHAMGGTTNAIFLYDEALDRYEEENPGFIDSLEGKSPEEQNRIINEAIQPKVEELGGKYQMRLSLRDEEDKEIESFTYDGMVNGPMKGLMGNFKAGQTYDKLALKATLMDSSGKVVDESVVRYDCATIGDGVCLSKRGPLFKEGKIGATGQKTSVIVITLLAIILILVIAMVMMKKKGKGKAGGMMMFGLIFVMAMMMNAGFAKAKSESPEIPNKPDSMIYKHNGLADLWALFDNYNLDLTYDVRVEKDGQVINDGSQLCPGDEFKVVASYSGTWNGQGYNYDTPPVHWNQGATFEINESDDLFHRNNAVGNNAARDGSSGWLIYDHYTPFVFNNPNIAVSGSGVSCSQSITNGEEVSFDCTVSDDVGPNIDFDINFDSTYGKPYYYTKIDADWLYYQTMHPPGSNYHESTFPENNQPLQGVMLDNAVGAQCNPMSPGGQSAGAVYISKVNVCGNEIQFDVNQISIPYSLTTGDSCVTPIEPECNSEKVGGWFMDENDLTGGDWDSLCSEGVFDSITPVTSGGETTAWTWSCVDPNDSTLIVDDCQANVLQYIDVRCETTEGNQPNIIDVCGIKDGNDYYAKVICRGDWSVDPANWILNCDTGVEVLQDNVMDPGDCGCDLPNECDDGVCRVECPQNCDDPCDHGECTDECPQNCNNPCDHGECTSECPENCNNPCDHGECTSECPENCNNPCDHGECTDDCPQNCVGPCNNNGECEPNEDSNCPDCQLTGECRAYEDGGGGEERECDIPVVPNGQNLCSGYCHNQVFEGSSSEFNGFVDIVYNNGVVDPGMLCNDPNTYDGNLAFDNTNSQWDWSCNQINCEAYLTIRGPQNNCGPLYLEYNQRNYAFTSINDFKSQVSLDYPYPTPSYCMDGSVPEIQVHRNDQGNVIGFAWDCPVGSN